MPDPGERQAIHLFAYNSFTNKFEVIRGTTDTGLTIVDIAHSRVHEGKFFSGSKLWGFGGVVANGANADLLLRCGVESHLIIEINVSGDCELFIYEDTTVSANGTAVTIYNKNRSSTKVSGNTLFHTPTVTGVGTNILPLFLPGGRGGSSDGGTADFTQELVLKAGKVYLFRVTNRSGVTAYISTTLQWYEPGRT